MPCYRPAVCIPKLKFRKTKLKKQKVSSTNPIIQVIFLQPHTKSVEKSFVLKKIEEKIAERLDTLYLSEYGLKYYNVRKKILEIFIQTLPFYSIGKKLKRQQLEQNNGKILDMLFKGNQTLC